MRTRTTFDKVSLTGTKRIKCETGCGASVARQRTFWQTINPFNVHALTKLPKDRAQIYRELGEQIEAWKREPERCAKCRELAQESL